MKSIIRWAVHNSPAMNVIMVAVLAAGMFSLVTMRREVFPEFELEIILVSVPYPQASPAEVEEGICQKVEEAVRSIEGIKKQFSVAQEGAGHVILELPADVPDVQKVLNEVRSEVDRIPSLPERSEDPEVKQLTLREAAIQLAVIAPEWDFPDLDPELRRKMQLQAQLELREVAEKVRDDLLMIETVSQADIIGARDYQIDVEISEATLREHGLSLAEVARIIRRENVEMPSGSLKTDSQEILLRGKNKQTVGTEIAKIPIVDVPGGKPLTVDDLGNVRDAFIDTTSINRINGKPAMVISVNRTSSEDLLAMTEAVREYAATQEMPAGYELETWSDRSVDVYDRMNLLIRNGLQGLALVFIVLAIFLEFRLAFWVALGIPVAVLGSGIPLAAMGHTLNMLSMFAFLMALGIVVDDAIVVGENIYSHRQTGKGFVRAAIDGTYEVLPAVLTSVGTTIIAFMPLLYVAGIMGKFIAVMPVAVIAMLVLSLAESTFVLPCHLGHSSQKPMGSGLLQRVWLDWVDMHPVAKYSYGFLALALAAVLDFFIFPIHLIIRMFHWLNVHATRGLSWVIERLYVPSLRWSLNNPGQVVALSIALLLCTFGMAKRMNFSIMPKLDSKWIEAKVVFPDGTPAAVTDAATKEMEAAIGKVNKDLATETGKPVLKTVHRALGSVSGAGIMGPNTRSTGSHVGGVNVELVEVEQRNVDSAEVIRRWREATAEIAGADSVKFGMPQMGPGGIAIEFKLLADKENFAILEEAVEKTKNELKGFDGVFDVDDDSRPGKPEIQLAIRDDAKELGVRVADVAETVRAAYYGEEVMRLQRGRHEVKLMVRYPKDERQSLAAFEELRIRTDDGVERYITEVAEMRNERGYSEINRVDQVRSITITADVDEAKQNAENVVASLKENFLPGLFEEHPEVSILWEGQAQRRQESMQSLMIGLCAALAAMFVLLTLQFRAYFQPLLILAIIPFGFVGAIFGHALMGMDLTLFTMFGLVALTGVVVNDSIVLVDFINKRLREGMPVKEALVDAGRRRFRPILLTSITTCAGLFPILTETSFQAQILIPMAAALCYGLVSATGLILILVPTYSYIYAMAFGVDTGPRVLESEPVAMLESPRESVIHDVDGEAVVLEPDDAVTLEPDDSVSEDWVRTVDER